MTSFTPGPGTERLFRDALGNFATGVTVVTARDATGPCAITANSFSAVSLAPPLVLWAIARSSDRFDTFAGARHTAIHVLDADQGGLALDFARSGRAFAGVDWTADAAGTPHLTQFLSRFECETQAAHDGGDHLILVSRVLHVTLRDGAPLLFHRGCFGDFRHRDRD